MALLVTEPEKVILDQLLIPPRPQILLKITQQARMDEPDVAMIAEAIASDVGLSGAVLQVVNSAAFRRATTIRSIHQAVMTLGLDRVLLIVKAVALKSCWSDSKALEYLWGHSQLIANCAALLAEELGYEVIKDKVYMLGLFHQSGVAALYTHFDDYSELLAQNQTLSWRGIADIERERYSTSHPTVAALIAQKWGLPTALAEAIYYQYDWESLVASEEMTKAVRLLVVLLKLAKVAADKQSGQPYPPSNWYELVDATSSFLGLDEGQLEEVLLLVAEKAVSVQ